MVKRVSETSKITAVDETTETEGSHHSLVGKEVPPGVLIFRVFGAFFFGVVDKLDDELKRRRKEPDILILRVRKVLAMDATGLQALEDLRLQTRRQGQTPDPQRASHATAAGDDQLGLHRTARQGERLPGHHRCLGTGTGNPWPSRRHGVGGTA